MLSAVSMCFAIPSGAPDRVPNPRACLDAVSSDGMTERIVGIAGTCLNTALEAAANEPQPANRVFSSHNWIKAKTCLAGINAAIRQYFAMLPTLPGGKELSKSLRDALTLPAGEFEYRWAAD